jgi:hypothetical protein
MARPRKGEEKDRPKHLGFRVATWAHDGVQRLAGESGQPASEVAHDLLEAALRRRGIEPSQEEKGTRQPSPKSGEARLRRRRAG